MKYEATVIGNKNKRVRVFNNYTTCYLYVRDCDSDITLVSLTKRQAKLLAKALLKCSE